MRFDFRPGQPPAATRTRVDGLAAADAIDQKSRFFCSSPGLDDAERLSRRIAGENPAELPGTTEPTTDGVHVAAELETTAIRAMERVAAVAHRAEPRARFGGRAVVSHQHVLVARPGAAPCEDTRISLRIRMMAAMERGGHEAAAVVETALHHRARTFKPELLDRLALELVRRAERRLDAREAPAGRHPIVLAPGVGGVLVHELVGHALEADLTRSWIARIDGPVAPAELNVIDDPRAGRAAWKIDDEGVEARATALIREGRVVGRLHDRRTARRDGVPPTGHGRRASYRDPVLPRMGCTFVAAGRLDPRELVADTGNGIYVHRMEAAHVDTDNARAVFRVTEAERILSGRVCVPLHPFVMVVDGHRALAQLTGVGSDLTFDSCIGSCHRDGQTLSITVGAPTICIGVAGVIG